MATATPRMVSKVVTTEVEDGVILELSQNEAEALAVVLRKIGGIPEKTRRGYTALILRSLIGAGVKNGLHLEGDAQGGIMFDELSTDDSRRADLYAAGGL